MNHRVRLVSLWLLSALMLWALLGPVAGQEQPSAPSEIQAARLDALRATEQVHALTLQLAACTGQLTTLFEEGFGTAANARRRQWQQDYEQTHPNWIWDWQAMQPRAKQP